MTERPQRPEALDVDPGCVPDELADRDHWLVWKYEFKPDRGEWSKVPKDGDGNGYNINATDPENGVPFDTAVKTYRNGEYDGLGFITDADGLLVGFDWDDCRDPEQPHGSVPDVVSDAIDELDTYTELSPSGTGYRQFALGTRPDGKTRADLPCKPVLDETPHLEIYDGTGGRYLTVTGQHVDPWPATVETRPQETKALHAEYIEEDDDSDDSSGDSGRSSAATPTDLDDRELIEKAKSAGNGDKFERLWNGSTAGYESHSEADAALCSLLAFWTGEDATQIDRLFRQSGLIREKWDESRGSATYGELTIENAIANNSDVYEPSDGNSGDGRGRRESDTVSTDELDVTLCPDEFAFYAGLGEDDSISDLSDRQKASYVWDMTRDCDTVHVRVNRDNDELWAYDPDTGTWNPDGERALRHAARKAVGAVNYGGNVLDELKNQVRADPSAEVFGDTFGLDPGQIAVKNGLLDLNKAAEGDGDAIRPLKPEDYALARLPVEYDPEASGEWREFVADVVEGEMIDAVQEYVGYCLHRGSSFDRSLLLVGGGANGKSTFLNTVGTMLGEDNTSNVSPYDFGDKPSLAELHGNLANVSADLAGGSLQGKNLGNFKKLTGGDSLTAKRLYQDPFEFKYHGGMLFAANEVPDVPVSDDDAAFWRRWIVVHFNNYFPEGSDKRDPHLEDRLQQPENLSALLNWAVEGWARLMDQGEFTNVPSMPDETRRKWQRWGDSIEEFLSDVATRDTDAENISTGEAYRVYRSWCRENDRDAVGRQKFTSRCKDAESDLGYTTSIRTDRSPTPVRGYAAFGTTDEHADPIDVIQQQDEDRGEEDSSDTRNTGLDSYSGESAATEGGERDTEDANPGVDGLKPAVVMYVRDADDGRTEQQIVKHITENEGVDEDTALDAITEASSDGRITQGPDEKYRT